MIVRLVFHPCTKIKKKFERYQNFDFNITSSKFCTAHYPSGIPPWSVFQDVEKIDLQELFQKLFNFHLHYLFTIDIEKDINFLFK